MAKTVYDLTAKGDPHALRLAAAPYVGNLFSTFIEHCAPVSGCVRRYGEDADGQSTGMMALLRILAPEVRCRDELLWVVLLRDSACVRLLEPYLFCRLYRLYLLVGLPLRGRRRRKPGNEAGPARGFVCFGCPCYICFHSRPPPRQRVFASATVDERAQEVSPFAAGSRNYRNYFFYLFSKITQ